MNFSKIFLVIAGAIIAFSGNAEAGKGSKTMGRIGHGIVSIF